MWCILGALQTYKVLDNEGLEKILQYLTVNGIIRGKSKQF